MARTLADTIREITKRHLDNGGLLLGQAITAVGYVNNTVPQHKNIVELPMCDVAGAGFAVGTAIVGKRPILVVRFQDFMFLNGSVLVNYAAKSKEIFGQPCPIFIRAIVAEGYGIGIVHSTCLHSIFAHIPSMKVVAPMTPNEYQIAWDYFMENDEPMFVSEHRWAYEESKELQDIVVENADATIYAISGARFSAMEAVEVLKEEGIRCNLIHIFWLKPLDLKLSYLEDWNSNKLGLVVDSDYGICGIAESVAYNLMRKTGKPVKALGRRDNSTGVGQHLVNGTPTAEQIVAEIKSMVRGEKYGNDTRKALSANT